MRHTRHVWLWIALSLPAAQAAAQSAGGAEKSDAAAPAKAVLELFTSQGCSSCPPADALFNTYAARKDIVTLSFHVDYWDYLGWKDTLASGKFTQRQRAYAKTHGDGMVYTPQVVVNGRDLLKGSNRGEIEKAVERSARQFGEQRVPLRVRSEGGQVVIEAGAAAPGHEVRSATVWLASVQARAEVTIHHGENSGKTLVYSNIVREITQVGTWSGKPEAFRVVEQKSSPPEAQARAALLQAGNGGPILGIAWLEPR